MKNNTKYKLVYEKSCILIAKKIKEGEMYSNVHINIWDII